MKKQIMAAAIGACLAMPIAAHADDTMASGGNLSAADMAFVNAAAQSGMDEIKTSKVAQKKSDNKDILAYAKQMVNDHDKADDQLKSIAKKMNVTLPTSLDAVHKSDVEQLQNASKTDFDQKYVMIQDKGHEVAVAAFQKEASSGDNGVLKQYAAQTLPVLQQHLKEVKTLEAKMPPATGSGSMNTSGSMNSSGSMMNSNGTMNSTGNSMNTMNSAQ